MYGLRHKKVTSKQGAIKGGSSQKSNTRSAANSERSHADHAIKSGGNSKRSNVDRRGSVGDGGGDSERSNADHVNSKMVRADGLSSGSAGATHVKSTRIVRADGVNSGSARTPHVNSASVGPGHGNSTSVVAAGGNSRSAGAGGVNSTHPGGNSASAGVGGVNSTHVNSGSVRASVNSESCSIDGVNSRMVIADGVNSERSSANGLDHERAATNVVMSQENIGTEADNTQQSLGSMQACGEASKRGRGKMCRTQLKMAPRSGRIQLEPLEHSQFKYVGYNPKGYKYPSQIGAILKREYPGIIKVYDENGEVVKRTPAFSWNDYYWKKNKHGVCYAQRVKQEFWSVFTTHPRHRSRASKNLENYLVKRVTNMLYQVRLEAVKIWCHKRKEECDDTRARTIELTEAQYRKCRVEWCNKAVWASLCKYWVSDEYKAKRQRAKEARMSSEDPAQNRGGSRNFAETQQFLEYTFGPDKSNTLNTYAVMKSGLKNVDSTGRSGPIPSQKAQKRLDDYKALAPDESSNKLDGKALYTVGNGMKHGRVPIGDGAVDKAEVLLHAKSGGIKPNTSDHYQGVIKENEQLKETNETLIEENGVHRELVMRLYADFGKEPPADLLRRLENIDVRRHQTTRSSHEVSQLDDGANDNTDGEEEDFSYHEGDDDSLQGEDDESDCSLEDEDDDCSLEDEDDDCSLEDEDDGFGSDGEVNGCLGGDGEDAGNIGGDDDEDDILPSDDHSSDLDGDRAGRNNVN